MTAGCTMWRIEPNCWNDITPTRKPALSNVVLDVKTFDDIRHTVKDNEILFLDDARIEKNGKAFCINAEKNYEQGTVASQITKAFVKHLSRRGNLKKVTLNGGEGDYIVTAKLMRFYAEKEISPLASLRHAPGAAGVVFGVVGAAQENHDIEFTEITISDKKGIPVKRLNDVIEKSQGTSGQAGCGVVYEIANSRLHNALDKLAEHVEDAIITFQQAQL